MVTNKFLAGVLERHDAERAELLAGFQAEREGWARERGELLTRIQAPERVPVERGEMVQYDPPEDAAELAKVGQLFPEDAEENGNAGTLS